MKARNLIILAVVAVVLVALARMTSSRKGRLSKGQESMGKPLVEALQDAEKVNSVEKLLFESAGGTVTVARVDGRWVAPDKFNYPVKFDSVHDFVTGLVELKTGQPVPDAQLAELNLLAPGDAGPGESGTRVTLLDGDGNGVASLVVGKEHRRQAGGNSPLGAQFAGLGDYPDGRFVASGGKACLISETLTNLPDDPKDWLDNDLANMAAADIASVTVTEAGGETLALAKDPDGADLKLATLAEDEEMDTTRANNLCSVLSWLDFEDVADPAATDEALGFDKAQTYVATSKKGPVYTLTLGGSPEGTEDRYARLNAAYTPPPIEDEEPEPQADPGEEMTDEEKQAAEEAAAKKAEERLKKQEEQQKLADEVKALNDRTGGWTYVLKAYEVEAVTADRAYFVKEKEQEEDDATETEPPPVE